MEQHAGQEVTEPDIHLWQNLNPVVTEALTQLTWGAPQVVYNGGLPQARVRYYDPQRRRPGLPPDVAALVSSIDPAATTVTLVNLSGAVARTVVVQAGAFAEHDIEAAGYTWAAPGWAGQHTEYISHDVHISGREAAVGGPWLDVELPPGTEVTLTLRLRLRVRAPSARGPWDAAPLDAALGDATPGDTARGIRREGTRMGQLTGLRALVTGGASGLGAAIAAAFTAEGAAVVVLDMAEQAPAHLPAGAGYVQADVTDDAAVRAAVDAAAARLGGLDLLVNNAGVGAQGSVASSTDEEWRRVLDVNVIGTARVSRAAWPYLRESGQAAVVNTASIAATAGLPDRAVYSASKGAVAALTRAMAADGMPDGIRVNAVNPGTADTPWVTRLLDAAPDPAAERAALEARQPHGRLVSAGEVAAAVVYLASPAAGSTTGTELAVDGGMGGLRLRPRG